MKLVILVIATVTMLTCSATAQAGDQENAIAAECMAANSATPAAYAACVFGALTTVEALKCLTGDCLGENNAAVQFNQWRSHRLADSGSKQYVEVTVVNLTSARVHYKTESDREEGQGNLDPGHADKSVFEGYRGWVNVYGGGQSAGFRDGSIVAFETDIDGKVIVTDITPHKIEVANKCHQPMRIWVCYRTSGTSWVTDGHWDLAPNSTHTLIAHGHALITNSSGLYYYATAPGRLWTGNDLTKTITIDGQDRQVGMEFFSASDTPNLAYQLPLTCSN